jgi:hypothetical protein
VNRLWSRFGLRALAVALLLVGAVGGMYLGQDRHTQQIEFDATAVTQANLDEQMLINEQVREHSVVTASKRAAEQEAAAKAAAAAKVAAERARQLEEAASRQRANSRASASPSKSAQPPDFGPIPASCGDYTGNKAIGCALLLSAGFKLDQMPCLDKLWTRESHWNTSATNSSSGAYGIPQASPGSKMASIASDWRTNPATQIKWGLGYIEGRYTNPCGAWTQSQNTGWY